MTQRHNKDPIGNLSGIKGISSLAAPNSALNIRRAGKKTSEYPAPSPPI